MRHFTILFLFMLSLLSGCSTLNNYHPEPEKDPVTGCIISKKEPPSKELLETKEYKTVQSDITTPSVQTENTPLRTLEVAVVYETEISEQQVRNEFTKASALLESQVGVKLAFTLFPREKFSNRSFNGVRNDVLSFQRTHQDFDLYVGVVSENNFAKKCGCGLCTVADIVEQSIVVENLKANVITHEVGHALLPNYDHSPAGIMGVPISGDYFTRANRADILRVKWKDLRKLSPFPHTSQQPILP